MAGIRRILLILLAFGICATAVDLVLLEHYEGGWQLAPFVLLTVALCTAGVVALAPTHRTVAGFRGAMILMIVGGLAGLWLHYDANIEFERELAPERRGLDLVWTAIRGAAPPTLAPAALIHLGLLGLASTYRQLSDGGERR